MTKRIASMDVTIAGTTRSFEFDPPADVSYDEEGPASLELLGEAETTEVQFASDTIASARVEVSYTYRVSGSVTVDLSDLDVEDADDLQSQVEQGYFSQVADEALEDVVENSSTDDIVIDSVDVEDIFDEDGESIEDR